MLVKLFQILTTYLAATTRHLPTSPIHQHELHAKYPELAERAGQKIKLAQEFSELPSQKKNFVNDYEEFLDEFFYSQLDEFHAPAAATAVIDLKNNIEYSMVYTDGTKKKDLASKWLFRIASVSKSFTAIGIMMLIDDGKLSLDDTIDKIVAEDDLKFKGHNITIQNLLTHTAGFNEVNTAQIVPHEELMVLKDYLLKVRPSVLFKPYSVASYSNYGYALLGHIIETISGQSYEEFIRSRLLTPLEMHSSVLSPRDPAAVADNSNYWARVAPSCSPGATAHQCGPDLGSYAFQFVPAGQIMLTATDMARYLKFHLGGCKSANGTAALLSADSCHALHVSHFGPNVGVGFGTYENMLGPFKIFLHDGDMPTASSRMFYIPQQSRAIFMTINKGSLPTRDDLQREYNLQFGSSDKMPLPTIADKQARQRGPQFSADPTPYENTRYVQGGCSSMLFRLSNPAVYLNTTPEAQVDLALGKNVVPYLLIDNSTNSLFGKADSDTAAVLASDPFMFVSALGKDNIVEFTQLLSPIMGVQRTSMTFLYMLFGGIGAFIFAFLLTCCMCISCVIRDCAGHGRKLRYPGSVDHMKVPLVQNMETGGNPEWIAADADVDALTANDTDSSGSPLPYVADNNNKPTCAAKVFSERTSYRCTMWCIAPLMFLLVPVYGIAYLRLASALIFGFPAWTSAVLAIPFVIAALSLLSFVTSLVACFGCLWHWEQRILLTLFSTSFLFICVVFAMEDMFQTQCWH